MKFVKPLTETEIETLQHMHQFHPSRRARMRAHSMLLSHQGYKLDDIAQVYQASRRRVSGWIDRWQTRGLVGLYDQPRSGRPPIYSEPEQKQLDSYLQRHPQNIKRIIEEMANDTNKRVSPKPMRRYLKKNAKCGSASKRQPQNLPTPSSTYAVSR